LSIIFFTRRYEVCENHCPIANYFVSQRGFAALLLTPNAEDKIKDVAFTNYFVTAALSLLWHSFERSSIVNLVASPAFFQELCIT
jgi:hypothetical protein